MDLRWLAIPCILVDDWGVPLPGVFLRITQRALRTQRSWHHNRAIGRERRAQSSPDLFSTEAARDASPLPPRSSATEATGEPAPQRHVLPKNLRAAVKHLTDEELGLLHEATHQEMKRRGRAQSGAEADSTQSPAPLRPQDRQWPPTAKRSPRSWVDFVELPLTLGQVNVVRSAFRAGISPARIARQFGISLSNVRKVLGSGMTIHKLLGMI